MNMTIFATIRTVCYKSLIMTGKLITKNTEVATKILTKLDGLESEGYNPVGMISNDVV